MEVSAKTDIGRSREMNQDFYYIPEENDNTKIYILADGMGGYAGGEVASQLAVNSVLKYIHNNYEEIEHSSNKILELIKEAIEYANMMVYDKSKEVQELNEMGTTLDVVLIKEDKAYIGHVGDSKVYKIDGNDIRKITTDHSYVEKLVKEGKLTREEAINHPKKNMLIKAVGSNTFAMPDMLEIKLQQNDTILMCSDGLTNMISEDKILEIMNSNKDKAVEELINAANSAGGQDNITAIIIKGL